MLEIIVKFKAGGFFTCYRVKTLPALFFDGTGRYLNKDSTDPQAGLVPQF
jgi:hypothetical protein